jgi:L,D-peptidoglycan transpeptidase YkuD (ErfK/YbiS/YcfS/YnhG family)
MGNLSPEKDHHGDLFPMRSYSKTAPRKKVPTIRVRPRPGKPSQGLLAWGGTVFCCALGRGGISAIKREGDGATPLTRMRLLHGWFRAGRLATRRSGLALRRIGPDDGWCDAPGDRNYNRPVSLPYAASHERMRRDDPLYDVCIVLDWNIRPRRRGRGSAIFFHLARPDFTPTEGCIAVSRAVMLRLLPLLSTRTRMTVRR